MSNNKKNELVPIDNKNKALQIKDAAWNSLSEESKKAYTSDYKLFFEFIKKDPKNIVANDILNFVEYLKENNYKNNSINRKIASLSKFFKVMVLAGEIKNNPVEVLKNLKNINLKTTKGVITSLTMDEIKKVIKITKTSTDQDKKMSLIIRTLAMTGLRISEFINIKNTDISDYNNCDTIINIVGKGDKERKVYLEKSFIEEIRKIYPIKNNVVYLFYNSRNKKYDRRVLWKQIKDLFWNKIQKDVWPHLLRHAFITHKITVEKQDIKAVSLYAGHQDVSVTLNMYVDTALDSKNAKIKI